MKVLLAAKRSITLAFSQLLSFIIELRTVAKVLHASYTFLNPWIVLLVVCIVYNKACKTTCLWSLLVNVQCLS